MAENNCERLIIAALAVGGHPVEKVLAIEEQLRAVGLLDPENLRTWGVGKIVRGMHDAGYRRGLLNGMYAARLEALGQFAKSGGEDAQRVLTVGTEDAVFFLLSPVYGIGPKVIANFLDLRARAGGVGAGRG